MPLPTSTLMYPLLGSNYTQDRVFLSLYLVLPPCFYQSLPVLLKGQLTCLSQALGTHRQLMVLWNCGFQWSSEPEFLCTISGAAQVQSAAGGWDSGLQRFCPPPPTPPHFSLFLKKDSKEELKPILWMIRPRSTEVFSLPKVAHQLNGRAGTRQVS